MNQINRTLAGAGIGLRKELKDDLLSEDTPLINFLEIAPENWIDVGGKRRAWFEKLREKYTNWAAHGLFLSIGSPEPLDTDFLKKVKGFLDDMEIDYYSDHLSFCGVNAHLYDLLPIPFTEEAAQFIIERIDQVQSLLGRRFAFENISYYAVPGQGTEEAIAEIDFINTILKGADCHMMLDVNNVYVNSFNHGYDPKSFLDQIPTDRITYLHVAGHTKQSDDLIIDTHGEDVIDPVWSLLEYTYQKHGALPTLLERDFDIPPLNILTEEVEKIHTLQAKSRQELENV